MKADYRDRNLEIVAMYESGASLDEVARHFKLGLQSLRWLLRDMQVNIREERQAAEYRPTEAQIEEAKVALKEKHLAEMKKQGKGSGASKDKGARHYSFRNPQGYTQGTL